MRVTLEHWREWSLYPFSSEEKLLEAISELHLIFTQNRNQISEYWNDQRLVAAYAAFYAASNGQKLHFLWEQLGPWQEKLKDTQFIDFGSGPGTFSLALLELLEDLPHSVDFHLFDHSEVMLNQAKNIWKKLAPNININTALKINDLKLQNDKSRWLLFGNSSNEMSKIQMETILNKVKPHYLTFIEPGTPASFNKVMELRDHLFKLDYHVVYPCSRPQDSCPLTKISGEWCHQVLTMTPTDWLARLGQKLALDRHQQTALLHFYVHSSVLTDEVSTEIIRLIRVVKDTKHSIILEFCQGNVVWRGEIPLKLIDKSMQKKLLKRPSGMNCSVERDRQLESGIWRLKKLVIF